MSSGYASRLSEYPNKGVCGLPEGRETKRNLEKKLQKLAELVEASQHTVILTGAGISTSAGIPDFRGPNGIWTLEQQQSKKTNKRKRPAVEVDFSVARPTRTHRAIYALTSLGKVQYCITQNVDGLHRRSGLSRDHHSVLHGCVFTEKCHECQAEHYRDFDVGGMSFQETGRKCDECKTGALRDTLLDWEDPLPEDDLERSSEECERADLVITLGTSLRIEPAGSLPTKAKKFVIVNFQETPYDKEAELVLRAPVDDVMDELLKRLGHPEWEKEIEGAEIERVWKRP